MKIIKKSEQLFILAVILISVLFIAGCTSAQSGLRIDNKAPDFKLNDLQGQPVSLSSLRGKGVLVNFWSTA